MISYRAVLITNLDGETKTIEFDVVNSVNVNLSSTVTTHPVIEGAIMADHMYANPIDVNISGIFSTAGNLKMNVQSYDRIGEIQRIIERIKKEALFCELTTIADSRNEYEENSIRFESRENMIINSIMWNQFQNHVEFNIGLTEALIADAQTLDYNVDVRDPLLPAMTAPRTVSFIDTLFDMESVNYMIIQTLLDVELIQEEFLRILGTATLRFIIGGRVATWAIAATIKKVSLKALAVPVVGKVVAVVGLAIAAVWAIGSAARQMRERQLFDRAGGFRDRGNERDNNAEIERFGRFVERVHQHFHQLENVTRVFSISLNDSQEAALTIDNDIFIFYFRRNHSTGFFNLTVKDIHDDIIEYQAEVDPLTSLADATIGNALFRTRANGYQAYLLNVRLLEAIESGYSEEEQDEIRKDLSNYLIFVTPLNMENFNSMLADIIVNALRM